MSLKGWRASEVQHIFGGNPLHGVTIPPKSDEGFSDGRAKLTPSIVEAARLAHYQDPKANSVAKLAQKYGVTRATMHRAIQRADAWERRAVTMARRSA